MQDTSHITILTGKNPLMLNLQSHPLTFPLQIITGLCYAHSTAYASDCPIPF